MWSLSTDVAPGTGNETIVLSAIHPNSTHMPSALCWEIAECYDGGGINCNNGCKSIPSNPGCPSNCPGQ